MIALLEAFSASQALAIAGFGAPVAALGLAFLLYEGARFVRLAVTGRL